MTREDIIKLARQAGAIFDHMAEAEAVAPIFERFAALVAEYERNACAKVCRDMIDAEYKTGKVDHNEMAWTQACAAAIQARGNS